MPQPAEPCRGRASSRRRIAPGSRRATVPAVVRVVPLPLASGPWSLLWRVPSVGHKQLSRVDDPLSRSRARGRAPCSQPAKHLEQDRAVIRHVDRKRGVAVIVTGAQCHPALTAAPHALQPGKHVLNRGGHDAIFSCGTGWSDRIEEGAALGAEVDDLGRHRPLACTARRLCNHLNGRHVLMVTTRTRERNESRVA